LALLVTVRVKTVVEIVATSDWVAILISKS
jgi:hypothetical protein